MQPLFATLSLPLLGLAAPGASAELLATPVPATVLEQPENAPNDLLRAVPQDAFLFFGLWDVDGLRKRGEKSAWYRFLMDPQMQELVGAAGDLIEKAMAEDPDAPEIPFGLMDVCNAVHGSVAGFVRVVAADEEVVGGLLFDTGGKREGLEEIFDQILGLVEAKHETTTEEYGDAELVRMDMNEEDGHLIFIDQESLLGMIISKDAESGLEAVHGMLDRYTGKDPADGLAGSKSLTEARASAGGRMDVEYMVDLSPVVSAVLEEEAPDATIRGLLQKIGVTDLRWFYGGERIGSGEQFDFTLSGYLPPDTYISELFDLIGPAPLDMLKQIPAGSDQISVSSFDFYGLFKLVMRGIKEHDEEVHAQANGMIQMMGAMNGIDIEKDVLSQFTGDVGSFVIPPTGGSGGFGETMMLGLAPGGAVMIGLEDPEEFEFFVDDMLSNFQLDSMIETEEFQGTEIRKVDMGGPAVYFTFSDRAFLYSGSREPIQAVLRLSGAEDQPTAFDDKELRSLGGTGTLSLARMDTAGLVSMYLEMAAGLSEMMGMFGAMDAEDNPLTYLPWPDSDISKKYFKGHILTTMERSGPIFRIRSWSE